MFECIDNTEVAQALLGAVANWAQRRGMDSLLGPRGLVGPDGGGILVAGFEHQPATGGGYNFPYYDRLLTQCGFGKDRDFYSAHVTRDQGLPERFYRVAEKVRARRGLRIKSFRSRRELRGWIPQAVKAHSEAFSQNYTYYPPTPEEVSTLISTLLTVADPDLIKLVLKQDRIVGVVLALPRITRGLQRARGRLWPTGWFHILRERRRTKWMDLHGLGFLPEFQGLGGNAILYTELAKTLERGQYEYVEFVQVDEENAKSLREVQIYAPELYKTHRNYRKPLS
jgi:hypothetical protein